MSNEKETFRYAYSAKQQEEIKRIRQKYMPREEDKMEHLRRLDQSVTRKGTVWSLAVGIISSLVMGTGMSCCMVWGGKWFLPGILLGVIGMIGAALAYPVYMYTIRHERERVAPEIMRLTDELMK